MNKAAIRNYAVRARKQLIEAAKQRAFEYEITEDGENRANVGAVGGRPLTAEEKKQRYMLLEQIDRKGFAQVMEEAAYIWFNRFIALRFMEVNGYLPSGIRVFTDENGAFSPEILRKAMTVELAGLDREKVMEFLEKQDSEALYKYLIVTQCSALGADLPYMFGKIADWAEMLFPGELLKQDSVIAGLITDIEADDWRDEVEIIGWFYQYYISEKHEEVIDPLHGKIVKKEDIPAATQLFTTDWVVRYILDNSLGRYWIERHPDSGLAEKLTYFAAPVDGCEPRKGDAIRPEELKVLDPCVGSGHFLTYAFDILLAIYRESGWTDRDAARSIVENNLYGLDIDDRVVRLACFAVMMKAGKYDSRILSDGVRPHICAMRDSAGVTDELIEAAADNDAAIRGSLQQLRSVFDNAGEYGSIIRVPEIDLAPLRDRVNGIMDSPAEDLFRLQLQREVGTLLCPLLRQAEILSGKYDVVATNPPYLNKYSPRLKAYVEKHYAAYRGDLFSVFMFRNFDFCKPDGYTGYMTPMVWMFIRNYEELRRFITSEKSITTLIQFEYSAYDEATVPICSFVLKNGKESARGRYFRLSGFRGGMDVQRRKVIEALANKNCGYYYEASASLFSGIPGCPVAYWVSERLCDVFRNPALQEVEPPRFGMSTADNARFVRMWHEIASDSFARPCGFVEDVRRDRKWYPYNNGGEFRRWYGNNGDVVNWENDGRELREFGRAAIRNKDFYFREGITWTAISSAKISARSFGCGFLFSSAGFCIFGREHKHYLLALLNGKVGRVLLEILSPTLNYNVGDIARLPVILSPQRENEIDELTEKCVEISRADWDSFETSWDFKRHPLVPGGGERY